MRNFVLTLQSLTHGFSYVQEKITHHFGVYPIWSPEFNAQSATYERVLNYFLWSVPCIDKNSSEMFRFVYSVNPKGSNLFLWLRIFLKWI